MTKKIQTQPIHRNADIPTAHRYTLDEKRVFIVTPVYRNSGKSTKEILTKLMREETKKN